MFLLVPLLLQQNMSTTVDYKINLLDDRVPKAAGTATDDIVAVGLVYQF